MSYELKEYLNSINFTKQNLMDGDDEMYEKKYSSFIEVDSAFGGLAIYKTSSIPKNAKYIGENKNNNPICEHVRFHKFIKDSATFNNNPKINN